MLKIDKKLLNFAILSKKERNFDCVIYYNNKRQMLNFFNKNNIQLIKELEFLSAFVVRFNAANIFKAASLNCVQFISSVSNVSALMDVSREILGVNKVALWGSGVTVAFIDTGVSSHLDFLLGKNRIIKFCDFVNDAQNAYDDNGHGTFVCGVACGSGVVSNGKYRGVAPGANIIAIKALNANGEANAVTILEGMDWIYKNKNKYNISVVCMSFGSEPLGSYDPIMKGAEKLWQSGIVVVCAAGNSGPQNETIKSPGISRRIITVGGLDDKRSDDGLFDFDNFEVAKFSSRGPAFGKIKPDLVAPSVNITSCDCRGGYKQMSGTSVAAPMVAGLVAIIKGKYPNSTPDQIKKFLLHNAKTIQSINYAEGYGVAYLTVI